jgi:hypothetical protein
MTQKDIRIEYHKEAVNSPFTELFQLDVSSSNKEDVKIYIEYLEEKLINIQDGK